MRKKIQHVLLFTLIFSLFQGAGAYIGQETTPSLQNWYQSLNKAPLTPEGWVFAVVWPILYGMLALVFTDLLIKHPLRKILIFGFSLQMLLNWIWSFVFFSFHLTGLAALILSLLLATVFILFTLMRKDCFKTAWLLLPYIAWLCFAFYLNTYIYVYN